MTEPRPEPTGSQWRTRAVERSLRDARAKAEMRSERFLKSAIEILGETGRFDFTVQELVERSRTSLRSFYQHFGSKDELMSALFEEIISHSARNWEREIADLDAAEALHYLVLRIGSPADTTTQESINRALSMYHNTMSDDGGDYDRILQPLGDLVLSVIRRGAHDGVVRDDIAPEALAALLTQTLLGTARANSRGPSGENHISGEMLWQFCCHGIGGR